MPETGSWRFRWPGRHVSGQQAVPSWQVAAVSAVAGLALAAGAVTAAGPWDSGQRTAERARAAAQDREGGERHGGGPDGGARASAVLAALGVPARTAGDPPAPTSRGLADALDPLLRDPALGELRTAAVVDAATGRLVHGTKADTAAVPASTVKIATAVAALDALGPDHRLETEVVTGSDDGAIVLVGGGDPTLTREAPGKEPGDPASLPQLADSTARALKERAAGGERDGEQDDANGDANVDAKDDAKDDAKGDGKNGGKQRGKAPEVELAYDTSRYSGPARHPIGPNENIAPVSALMTDEGRLDDSDRGPAPRATDPAREAAEAFAGLLRDRGVDVKGKPRHAKAPRGADRLAAVASPPVSALVERSLTNSDNDIAEALARETAVAAGEPASFEGAGRAVRDRLARLGVPVKGARFTDGSGLDRHGKVSAALLAQLLVRSADPERPELRPVLTGLPVAGFSGTLRSRYADASAGTGMVRAKTGTLTGVNTLAGTVVDADGRLLAFAFMTNGSTDARGAQAALDRMASAVANCGCR